MLIPKGKKGEALKIRCDLISSGDYSSVSLLCVGLKFFVSFSPLFFSLLKVGAFTLVETYDHC